MHVNRSKGVFRSGPTLSYLCVAKCRLWLVGLCVVV